MFATKKSEKFLAGTCLAKKGACLKLASEKIMGPSSQNPGQSGLPQRFAFLHVNLKRVLT